MILNRLILSCIIVFYCSNLFAQKTAAIQQELNDVLLQHQHNEHHHAPEILQVDISNDILHITFDFHHGLPNEHEYDHLIESLMPALHEYGLNHLRLFYLDNKKEKIALAGLFPKLEIPIYHPEKNKDPFPPIRLSNEKHPGPGNPHFGQGKPLGSLTGKTVWLSAGHGWLNDNGDNIWRTQRGNTNGVVEDFGTVESINYYLQQYLHNAGANVWLVRERDVNTAEYVIDNDDSAPNYIETGEWTTSSSTGYNGSTYRFADTKNIEDATATYTPDFQRAGWYWVSTYFLEGDNRTVDAQYKINHAGGQTIVSINQEVHGKTWVHLGNFYFEKGMNGSVELSNLSDDAGQALIADAIRFGGGMGTTLDCDFDGDVSMRPRFEEGARQYAQFQGYPDCESDVVIRPHYAEWELAKGTEEEKENAIYVSWHTNAFNGNARGTECYSYNGAGNSPIIAGSDDLTDFIHSELVSDIKAEWDVNWNDRGTKTANFGELRELSTMPGTLMEIAFHDNEDDAKALKTPEFRNICARAVYQGIVKFFNNRDGSGNLLSPEPPRDLFAKNIGNQQIELGWNPHPATSAGGNDATAYKVYISTHGKGFQDSFEVPTNSFTFQNLDLDKTYYFQVSAINEGGESFPTSTVAARTPSNNTEQTRTLIVDGFDRLDASGNIVQQESSVLGNVERTFLERMNRYDYMVEHARALESCIGSFDGASNEVLINGDIDLAEYELVDWILGEESTVDKTLNSTEQTLIMDYLDLGRMLIISGAEIGWDLGRADSPNAAVDFYNDYLKASYVGDDAGTYSFSSDQFLFNNPIGLFDDGTAGFYNVAFPDRMTPTGGAISIVDYDGGSGDVAAVAYKSGDFAVANFGFPLEAITDEAVRNELICNTFTYLIGPAAVSSISKTPMLFYPNPTEGTLQVTCQDSQNCNSNQIEIYTLTGQLIQTIELNSAIETIQLDTYASGMYWVVLKRDGQVIQREKICKI